MRVVEIFRSIQGEGRLTGTPAIFVRASGCNLRCGYCDTPYASWSPEGEDFSVGEILARVEPLLNVALEDLPDLGELAQRAAGPARHAVVTGGEPMLFAELIPLADALAALALHVTVETAGTLYLPVRCDLMSISPKLSNSFPAPDAAPRWASRHAHARHEPDVIRRLIADYDYQLKFVIGTADDCREVEDYLSELPEADRARVMLMPRGIDATALAEKATWLEPYCVEHGLTYCPRRQIEWFGSRRGT